MEELEKKYQLAINYIWKLSQDNLYKFEELIENIEFIDKLVSSLQNFEPNDPLSIFLSKYFSNLQSLHFKYQSITALLNVLRNKEINYFLEQNHLGEK